MAGKSLEKIARESRTARLSMWAMIQAGKTEQEALNHVLPIYVDQSGRRRNTNRTRMFDLWKRKGLWPPPEVSREVVEGAGLGRGEEFLVGQKELSAPVYSELSEQSIPSAGNIPQEWLAHIRGLINTTINAAILDYHNFQNDQIEEIASKIIDQKLPQTLKELPALEPAPERPLEPPPQPATVPGTRKHVIPRVKLQGTCDRALFELFEQDRRRRGYNISQMIDFILYNFYSKPELASGSEPSR
ncbi:MAG: hypothetical protein AB1473_08455 [Thermodesulfobacteriota bacterium]